MNKDQKLNNLRQQVISLGKEVADSASTTLFPEWIYFKIGISALQGIPYDHEFWIDRMEPGVSDSSEN